MFFFSVDIFKNKTFFICKHKHLQHHEHKTIKLVQKLIHSHKTALVRTLDYKEVLMKYRENLNKLVAPLGTI